MEDFVIKLINKNSDMVEYEFYSKKDLEKKYKEGFEAGRKIVLAPDNSKIVVMNIDKKENTYTGFDIATGKKVSGKWNTVKPIGKILCRYYSEEDNNG